MLHEAPVASLELSTFVLSTAPDPDGARCLVLAPAEDPPSSTKAMRYYFRAEVCAI